MYLLFVLPAMGTPQNSGNSGNGNNNNRGLLDLDDPLLLHSNDLSSVSIVNFKLIGTANYKAWASATELALRARNKLGFVNGYCVRPVDDETKGRQWDRADAVVLSWLLVDPAICVYVSCIRVRHEFTRHEFTRHEFVKHVHEL